MKESQTQFIAGMFAALGHPTRLRMIEALEDGDRTVNEIAGELGIQQPNASFNLAALQRAGIVKATPHGAQRYYGLRGPRIGQMLKLAQEFHEAHEAAIQLERDADGNSAAV